MRIAMLELQVVPDQSKYLHIVVIKMTSGMSEHMGVMSIQSDDQGM